jgi:hypothetical protein
MLPNPRGSMRFFWDFNLPTLSLLTSILSKLLQMSNIHSFFLPSPNVNHSFILFFSTRLWERVFSRFELKIILGKKKASMIWIHFLKEKENEGGERKSQLSGQWKVPLLGGPWKVLCLVAFGGYHYLVANGKKRKNTFSFLPIFPLTNFT